ncbi:MAG: DUF5683 domain-containing protein [Bacteroidales bacterium]|nr:DUF5683 domain-containing protein [Bacteroidales bacterium]
MLLLVVGEGALSAQEVATGLKADSTAFPLFLPVDSISLAQEADSMANNTTLPAEKFIPNSARSTWLALIFPGAGQIYNRKYWKLPIIYGGFVGCIYALSWNGSMYNDYSQAYLDLMDDNPNTKSYEDFLPRGSSVEGNTDYYKTLFKNRKDLYRRQRDLSVFAMIGVYILSVIDAYVDAELSNFDITKELSMKVQPTVFNDGKRASSGSIGLHCSFTF